ncbi:MAG: hypothetical protein IT323_14685 [Anaerolineae bacterium]|nr:hypothetical protein [Anaerolineae bacterium]
MSTKRIASAFRFNEYDLNANREGKLSDAQRRALRRRRTISLALAAFALAAAVALLANSSAAMVCLAGFFGVGVLQQAFRVARLQRDLSAGRSTTHFGRIHLRVQNKRRSELFIESEMGLRRFRISTEQMLALRDGGYYTLYAAPRSDTLLSAEPVDVARDGADTGPYALDLGALTGDDEVEKPKRDLYVLGDDGELEMRGGRG